MDYLESELSNWMRRIHGIKLDSQETLQEKQFKTSHQGTLMERLVVVLKIWDQKSGTDGYFIVYPEGQTDSSGNTTWLSTLQSSNCY